MSDHMKIEPNDQLKEFLAYENVAPPGELATFSKGIWADLVHSPFRLALLYVGFSVGGYLVTLAVCSQGGVGLGSLSHINSTAIMQTLPEPWCSILCGALFSGVPFALSLALLNRFQRRFLIFRMFWLPLALSLLGCIVLLLSGQDVADLKAGDLDIAWMLSAIVTPYIGEAVLSIALRQKRISIPQRVREDL